jgi:hypothetical protein
MQRPLRYLLVILVVAGLSVGGWYAYQQLRPGERHHANGDKGRPPDPTTGKQAGKLVVLVVFDQMRGDYLAAWAGQFGKNGFERIKRDGVWYSHAEIPYACTSTGPGHASIATGAPPSVTGIIENEWLDRKTESLVYCVQPSRPYDLVPPVSSKKDGKASRGSELGFSPERLMAETVGDRLKAASDGKSRVFSLSIKDRTAVLMGGKKPDGVYCFDTRDGQFHTDTFYRDQPHPWVAEFNAAHMADRWFGKNWERFRPELDYERITHNPDAAAGENRGVSQGLIFPHPMTGGLTAIGPKYYEALETSPFGNELLLELVKKAIAAEKLGMGETADLLCISFSSTDLIGHRWGPDSWEVLDVTLRADQVIADLLGYLDSTVGKERYAMVITADHGVCPLPEQEHTRKQYPAAQRIKLADSGGEIFTPLTAALDSTFGPNPAGKNWFETNSGMHSETFGPSKFWPWIYLNTRTLETRNLKIDEVAAYVRNWLEGRAFIQAAFTRKQLETETFAPGSMGARARLAYYPDRCGDVIAIPKPGVLITPYESGTTHGTPQPYDSHVPILAVGSGIAKTGERGHKVSSLSVAPILAHALGIERPANAVEKLPAELAK